MFLEGVKITSVGLKLDRPQLQHWLLYLEHNTINRLRSKDLNVVAGLPVPVDYDCVYDLSLKLSQSFWFWVMQAPLQVYVEFE